MILATINMEFAIQSLRSAKPERRSGVENAELGRNHYLPRHEVTRTDKDTTKLCIVYDASARAERSPPSLNDCLYAGPPMTVSQYFSGPRTP